MAVKNLFNSIAGNSGYTGYGGGGSAYNISPAPRGGQGAFGAVPGAIGMPSPFSDLSSVYPNLSGTNAATSSAILNKLQGKLSPGTVSAIQDAAATFGVESGMPGFQPGSLVGNRGLRDIGLSSEQQTQQGLQDYANIIPVVSGTQTVRPELQTEIAATNAFTAAMPDPGAAASYAQGLFDKYLAALSGPAGGTGGYGGGAAGSGKKEYSQSRTPYGGGNTVFDYKYFA